MQLALKSDINIENIFVVVAVVAGLAVVVEVVLVAEKPGRDPSTNRETRDQTRGKSPQKRWHQTRAIHDCFSRLTPKAIVVVVVMVV